MTARSITFALATIAWASCAAFEWMASGVQRPVQLSAAARDLSMRSSTFGGLPTGESGNDDDMASKFWSEMTRDELTERSRELAIGGDNRLAAQYVLMLTSKHPDQLVRDFYASTGPAAQVAIQDAIMTLLGEPSLESTWTTTGQRVAELCFRLQMTGYMLRNAEYVLALRQALNLTNTNKYSDVRRAFERYDSDGDGYLSREEISRLFGELYDPSIEMALERNATDQAAKISTDKDKEVTSFLNFFDANADGLVSFDEFKKGLTTGLGLLDDDDDIPFSSFTPPVSGEIELIFKDKTRKIDAAEYVASLQAEVERLQAALDQAKSNKAALAFGGDPDAASIANSIQDQVTSITRYVNALDEEQRTALTNTITPSAQQAISELVSFVLQGAGQPGRAVPLDAQLQMERRVLEQLCRWQIIVGYRLRELEARGAASDRLGK